MSGEDLFYKDPNAAAHLQKIVAALVEECVCEMGITACPPSDN